MDHLASELDIRDFFELSRAKPLKLWESMLGIKCLPSAILFFFGEQEKGVKKKIQKEKSGAK